MSFDFNLYTLAYISSGRAIFNNFLRNSLALIFAKQDKNKNFRNISINILLGGILAGGLEPQKYKKPLARKPRPSSNMGK